jgi:hypothetical protein
MTEHQTCFRCSQYARAREARIRAEIAKTSTGPDAGERWHRFMAGVHDRHRISFGRVAAFMSLVSEQLEEIR